MEDRISVSVSGVGSVTVTFFYYRDWNFFVGADYAQDTESVMDHIKDEYITDGRTQNRLQTGFSSHEGEIEEAVRSRMDGGRER